MTLEDMFENHGYRTEEINGEQRYVTSDENGRAVVGPRRRAQRKLRWGRRPVQTEAAATVEVPGPQEVLDAIEADHSWSERARTKWVARFYDRQWHEATRHCAVDLAIWVSGVSISAAFVKGAWWVLSL